MVRVVLGYTQIPVAAHADMTISSIKNILKCKYIYIHYKIHKDFRSYIFHHRHMFYSLQVVVLNIKKILLKYERSSDIYLFAGKRSINLFIFNQEVIERFSVLNTNGLVATWVVSQLRICKLSPPPLPSSEVTIST